MDPAWVLNIQAPMRTVHRRQGTVFHILCILCRCILEKWQAYAEHRHLHPERVSPSDTHCSWNDTNVTCNDSYSVCSNPNMIRNRTHAIGVSKTDNSKRADLLDSSSADPLFAKLQLNCGHFLNALSVSLFPIPDFLYLYFISYTCILHGIR